MKVTLPDHILLLLTVLLCAYQIVVGINDLSTLPIVAYTIAFGVLLIATLLLLILGFDVLDSPVVVVVATIIPLSLSVGLVWENLPAWQTGYLIFAVIGFLSVLITRAFPMPGRLPTIVLTLVHGVAGMAIFLLPIVRVLQGQAKPGFALVGLGGALIGAGGLLLSFMRIGKPILPRETLVNFLPALLWIMTTCFVVGFYLA
jgi:hypothetical protein